MTQNNNITADPKKDRVSRRETPAEKNAKKNSEPNKPFSEDENAFRQPKQVREDIIVGRNAAREALKSGRPIDSVLVQKGEMSGAMQPILAECRARRIPVKEADVKKLDYMCGGLTHQGIVMVAAVHQYASLDDIFNNAQEKGEPPLIVICDSLEDPHNLGAIIRSADAAGVHGIIIPERRSVSLSGIVGKTSAGALEYVPVVRVKNLNDTIKELKKRGVWVFAADMDGAPYRKTDFTGAVAIVAGSEGAGVSRLVKSNCDGVVSVPMHGHVNSLNVSVATALLIFEAAAQRENKKGDILRHE